MEPAVPERFQLLRSLGEGGMGVVFEAFDRERNARVALKTLKALSSRKAQAEALLRFKREFRALQDLHHVNLVTLGELIAEGRQWFFTMELVEGEDLLAHVRPRSPMDPDGVRLVGAADPPTGSVDDPPVSFRRLDPKREGRGDRLDEARLRAALPQLVAGLEALHGAGKVHRDIKPSNIRVTPAGRVVLLDFGLVAEVSEQPSTTGDRKLRGATGMTVDGEISGTPAYMAPEQATERSVGPEADWYALGVVLYEALTGRLPFDGTPLDILIRKQRETPPAPSEVDPAVPPDLDALCMRLLRFEPERRPSGAEVARALDVRAPAGGSPEPASIPHGAPFVGRARELASLEEAFLHAQRAEATVVIVDGESGVGKSCLVRRFIADVVAAHPEAVVLAGRCYEREQVPYKGLDGVIDELARHLAALPDAEALGMVPARSGPLVQVFPVLRRSRALAFALTEEPGNPRELRRRAFAALRALLAALAARHPVVLAIDDLQWADGDTLSLLSELLRGPDAPSLLLVATVLDTPLVEGSMASKRLGVVDVESRLSRPVRRISLGRLSDDDGRALAASLLEALAPERTSDAPAIAREAQGHPLFIDELAHHAALLPGRDAPRPQGHRPLGFDLDEALMGRIRRLEPEARETLELVAVAGRPLAQECVALAARMEMGAFGRVVAQLRVARLVQTGGARASDRIEPYHDRVRGAVVGRLTAAQRAACHKKLALALEASRWPDGEALAVHWARAGNPARAAKHAVAAGHQASEALAFDRAAACWQRAVELTAEDDPRRRVLRVRLGEALANAGRGALAARAYARAADGAPPTEALDLRRRAAEQFLRSGRFDEGLAAVRDVLEGLGLRYPRSPVHALVQLVFLRLLLSVRGMGFRERDPTLVPARDLARVDICWSVAFSLGLSDHIYGAVFQVRAMLFALRAGEPTRVARAMAVAAGYQATGGGRASARVEAHLAKASAIAERTRDPQSIAYTVANAALSRYLTGDFRRALDDADRAEAMFRDVPGAAWEQATMHQFALIALVHLGELRELRRRQPRYLRDALDRGDTYASVSLRIGYASFAWLVRGDPDGARREAHEAMATWSKDGCHLEHFYELVALANADLYQGRAEDALRRVDDLWPALRRAMLLRIETVRIRCLDMRARCALAAVAAGAPDARGLLARAERDARGVARVRAAWGTPLAGLVRASAASVRGERRKATALLRETIAQLDAADMALHAAAARWRLARLVDDDESAALEGRVKAWVEQQGGADMDRLTAVVAPGFEAPWSPASGSRLRAGAASAPRSPHAPDAALASPSLRVAR